MTPAAGAIGVGSYLSTRLERRAVSLRRAIGARVATEETALEHTLARVRTLSPRATLQRGYSILTSDDGRTITSIAGPVPEGCGTAEPGRGYDVAAVKPSGRAPLTPAAPAAPPPDPDAVDPSAFTIQEDEENTP